ncbi:TetR/AcrR family transcriptional regulator [Svornostia abyssi]|uniref:TetR/AcrR family transcriptional regulator n=1 Tax=Svornostia abyssi TaxID=2898438 RepID=A0ABY5PL49_9ACTN|nr:TetR/AcrR family transcriptional regulator [Parviterribacteraceae bacterium J379]
MATNGTRSPRADAERNRSRILEHAARLIASDPEASMVQIAEASGVGRATLYRHFASREEVVNALREQAFTRAQSIIADALAPGDNGAGPSAKLGRLIAELLDMSEPYGLIADQDPRHHAEARQAFDASVLPLIEQAQAAGEFTSDVSALAIGFALEGLMMSANRAMQHGEMTPDEARIIVQRGMLRGFAADTAPAVAR